MVSLSRDFFGSISYISITRLDTTFKIYPMTHYNAKKALEAKRRQQGVSEDGEDYELKQLEVIFKAH